MVPRTRPNYKPIRTRSKPNIYPTCIFSVTSILAQKDKPSRAKMITDFINIADELLKLNNFSSFIAIINALEGSSISRLQSSWNKVI